MQWHLGIAIQLWQSATRSCLFCCNVALCVPQSPQSVGLQHGMIKSILLAGVTVTRLKMKASRQNNTKY